MNKKLEELERFIYVSSNLKRSMAGNSSPTFSASGRGLSISGNDTNQEGTPMQSPSVRRRKHCCHSPDCL